MKKATIVPCRFSRPLEGVTWTAKGTGLNASGLPAWQSHGGVGSKHPFRALPSMLEVPIPRDGSKRLQGVSIYGVFALFGGPESEPSGSVGASVRLLRDGKVVFQRDLVQGRHYSDALGSTPLYKLNGDATLVESVGEVETFHGRLRVDRVSFELPGGIDPDTFVFRDLGSPASFLIFDVLCEFAADATCPFKGGGNHVALSEVGSIIRMRDRHRLDSAIHQLCAGLRMCARDLDEARGLSTTFVAAIVAATIEIGAPRAVHKAILEHARALDRLDDLEAIVSSTVTTVHDLTDDLIERENAFADPTVFEALQYVAKNFARDIDDGTVAEEVQLSRSHFRHLFRQATNQPFHRYLATLRLEKGRELVLQSELPVLEIARAVGFQSSAHFTRAFVKRFGVPPTALRESRR